MNISKIIDIIRSQSEAKIDVFERRPGRFQLILPILHEDGDMVDVYIQESPKGEGYIRICDYGMSLMRLSYTFEINSDNREGIFNSILINNDVTNDGGNLYLESSVDALYENILKFVGCVQKVCGMRYWGKESKERKKSKENIFYADLNKYILDELADFDPIADHIPLPSLPLLKIDWMLHCNQREIFLFGVPSTEKAKNVIISLFQSQKKELQYTSIVVCKDIKTLRKREKLYIGNNSDHQYPNMDDFREQAISDIKRLTAPV